MKLLWLRLLDKLFPEYEIQWIDAPAGFHGVMRIGIANMDKPVLRASTGLTTNHNS